MKKRLLIVSALATVLTLQSGFILADNSADKSAVAATVPSAGQKNTQSEDQEQIYGFQLMTPQERAAFHTKMLAAKTVEERQQIRRDNHQAMQERAKAQGVSLPDQPAAGMGAGMGHGGGMGSGRGRSQ